MAPTPPTGEEATSRGLDGNDRFNLPRRGAIRTGAGTARRHRTVPSRSVDREACRFEYGAQHLGNMHPSPHVETS
ncbi:hypothetical protein GCM10010297_17900 [Streptomyces malachitofuscus]|nr:hypothetical protein GCM10010297_17900 [Streptomyces malachitofuscus]